MVNEGKRGAAPATLLDKDVITNFKVFATPDILRTKAKVVAREQTLTLSYYCFVGHGPLAKCTDQQPTKYQNC